MADIEDLLRDSLADDKLDGSTYDSLQDPSNFIAIKREASPEEPLISQPYHGVIELSDSELEAEDDEQKNWGREISSIDAANRIVELPDSEDENDKVVKEEPCEPDSVWEHAGGIIELSDSEDDLHNQSSKPSSKTSRNIKQEKIDGYFRWDNLPKEIEISDDDTELDALKGFGASPKRIKREVENDRFDWMEMENTITLSDSDNETSQPKNPLGKSFLTKPSNALKRKQPCSDPDSMNSLRARPAEEPREGCGAKVGSRNALNRAETSDSCGQASRELNSPSQPKQSFAEAKKAYREKKRKGENTLADDVAFKKAQAMELAEIRRREIELSDEENDGDEESEDGLFIPEDQLSPSRGDNENSMLKTSHRRKRNSKPRPWYSKSDIEKQLSFNAAAGMPEKLLNTLNRIDGGSDKKPKESQTLRSENYTANTRRLQQLLDGLNPGAKRGRKTATLNNIDSLAELNFFETTAAAHEKESLPLLTGKNKKKAMAELIASIPLEKEQATKARADKASIEHSSKVLRNCTINEDAKEGEGSWSLKGMTCALHHHQIQGVAKMKERESDSLITAGILADAMGLGKTVQAIALMVANPPPSEDQYRATLVVCSAAIINQWDSELETKKLATVLPIVIRHYGRHTLSSKGASGVAAVKTLESADVVLTTYTELIKSYPKYEMPEEIKDPKAKRDHWQQRWEERRGVLHRVHWYRVILDEAQIIKNHTSCTSIASRALMGQKRWALSGTPISNTLMEFYPYFKFLQIQHTGTAKVFQKNFCGNGSDLYNQRLHAFLDHIMIRRVYSDELMGRALLTLPKCSPDIRKIQLNATERLFYDIISCRFIKALNTASKEGELARKEMIIRKLLRLRQITSHIMMLQDFLERIFEVKDIDLIWSESEEVIANGTPVARDCISAIKALIEAKDQDSQNGVDANKGTPRATEARKSTRSQVESFWAVLRDMKRHRLWADLRLALLCQRCSQFPDGPLITSCLHLYCRACLTSMSNEAAGAALAKTKCLKCGTAYNNATQIPYLARLKLKLGVDVDSESLENEKQVERPRRTAQNNLKWCLLTDKVLQSSKSKAVEMQIEEWMQANPKTKIVVFSQFHLFMKVLEKICLQNGWKYCTYHGEMSHDAREEVLEQFRKEAEISVMIASLTCGGIGLNLTMAQRVIIVDLWFNSSLEKQALAFGRVYRIGQSEETFMTRFVVEDTVDEKLLAMQERKSKEIGKAIDNREVLMGMTVEQLLGLFGEVRRDAQNAPFIYVQDNPIFRKLPERVINPDGDDSA